MTIARRAAQLGYRSTAIVDRSTYYAVLLSPKSEPPGDAATLVAASASSELLLERNRFSVTLETLSTDKLFWRGNNTSEVGSDLRLIANTHDELDGSAIYALLTFGAVPPPLTLFKGINSAAAGTTVRSHGPNCANAASARPAHSLESALDDAISGLSGEPLVFLSGGVDSAAIAHRARLKLGKIHCVHLSFEANDVDTIAAREVAQRLSAPLDVVTFNAAIVDDVLAQATHEWPDPFCDYSTPASLALVRHVSNDVTVLDGVGADGGFGLDIGGWLPIAKLPRTVLAGAGVLNRALTTRLWGLQSLSPLRATARLGQLPLLPAAVAAQHSVSDVFTKFHGDAIGRAAMALEAVGDDIAPIAGAAPSLHRRAVLIDLRHVCARVFAQKTAGPLLARGHSVVFPFLTPAVGNYALGRCPERSEHRKGEVKRLLRDVLPARLVDRPKRGFTPGQETVFRSDALQDALRSATTGELAVWLDVRRTHRLAEAVLTEKLHPTLLNFAWALAFTDAWLRGFRRG